MTNLPAPATAQEMYQAAILAELQAIRRLLTLGQGILQADLQPASVVVAPAIELKEAPGNPGRRRRP